MSPHLGHETDSNEKGRRVQSGSLMPLVSVIDPFAAIVRLPCLTAASAPQKRTYSAK